jgi:hypothetical protein
MFVMAEQHVPVLIVGAGGAGLRACGMILSSCVGISTIRRNRTSIEVALANWEAARATVRRLLGEFLSCGDAQLADQLLAPEYSDHSASNPHLTGLDSVKQTVRGWRPLSLTPTISEL